MIQNVICLFKIILLAELKWDINLDTGLFPLQEELENNALETQFRVLRVCVCHNSGLDKLQVTFYL